MEAPAKPYTSIIAIPKTDKHEAFYVTVTSAEHCLDPGIQNPTGGNGKVRGAGLGGIRVSDRDDPVAEARGLAMAMTYKWDAFASFLESMRRIGQATDAQVDAARMGGMKTVVKPTDMEAFKAMTEEEEGIFWSQAVAAHFNSLDGRGIAAPDMGTNSRIMDMIAKGTEWVACTTETTGDPSPVTAAGVWDTTKIMVAALQRDQTLGPDVVYAIQGIGNVGRGILERILPDNPKATIYVTDKPKEKKRVLELVERLKIDFPRANIIFRESDEFWSAPAQVFIPCAGPEELDEKNLDRLDETGTAKLIVSAANDPYPLDKAGRPQADYIARLYALGIVAPAAWTANMGGIASIALRSEVESKWLMGGLGNWIVDIYNRAKKEGRSMELVSVDMIHEYHAALCMELGLLDQPLLQ